MRMRIETSRTSPTPSSRRLLANIAFLNLFCSILWVLFWFIVCASAFHLLPKELALFVAHEVRWNTAGRGALITVEGQPGAGQPMILFEQYRRCADLLMRFEQGCIPLFVMMHEVRVDLIEQHTNLRDFLVDYYSV